MPLSDCLTFTDEKKSRAGIISQHVFRNTGHSRVNPAVFTGIWVYLPFCTSSTTKPDMGPLHVTRKQTTVDVIERSKKKAKKKMRKREKRHDRKNKEIFISHPVIL